MTKMKGKHLSKNLYVNVLLDRSGSMSSIQNKTIDAFNEYVNSLAMNEEIDAKVTLTIFDSQSTDNVFTGVKAKEAPALTTKTYVPRGMTPLYDAIGATVGRLNSTLGKDDNVALVIITDGQENCSREYTSGSVKTLLDMVQKDKNWMVLYLGANQDAFTEGHKFGTLGSHTHTFNVNNIGETFHAAARSTMSYGASGQAVFGSFTDDERKEMSGT